MILTPFVEVSPDNPSKIRLGWRNGDDTLYPPHSIEIPPEEVDAMSLEDRDALFEKMRVDFEASISQINADIVARQQEQADLRTEQQKVADALASISVPALHDATDLVDMS